MNALVKFPAAPMTTSFFNGLLDDIFDRNLSEVIGGDWTPFRPAVNIRETDDSFKIELAAPGFEKSDFNIHLDGDMLTISGEKKTQNTEETTQKFTRREFYYSKFSRSFTLPKTIQHENIGANYENGILYLNVPKKEEARKVVRTIEIG